MALRTATILSRPNKIPPEGTIPRCPHGIYDPDNSHYGCWFCREPNFTDLRAARKFVIPSNSIFNDHDKILAHAHAPGSCSKCGSRVHIEVSARLWRCADCSNEFSAPHRHNAEIAEADLVAA